MVAPIPEYLAPSEGSFSRSFKCEPEHSQKNLFILFTLQKILLCSKKKEAGRVGVVAIGVVGSRLLNVHLILIISLSPIAMPEIIKY